MRFVIFTISKRNERTVLDIYTYKRSRPIYSTDLWSINDRIASNRVRKKSIREELILPTDFLSIFKPCAQLLLNLNPSKNPCCSINFNFCPIESNSIFIQFFLFFKKGFFFVSIETNIFIFFFSFLHLHAATGIIDSFSTRKLGRVTPILNVIECDFPHLVSLLTGLLR